MKDWKTNTWWQCQMILCTQTVAVVGREKTHLWCCVILSTPTCLGQGSFLVKQLLQFGTGVLIRSVLYHSVKYFIWSQIYIFALYYLMIFPKILYYSFTITLLVLKGFARPYSPPPPPEVFSGFSFCKILPVKHPIRMHHLAWRTACYDMSVTWP